MNSSKRARGWTADEDVQGEQPLPRGYCHIRSAIRALMAAETGPDAWANQAEERRRRAVGRIHEAIAELRKTEEGVSET